MQRHCVVIILPQARLELTLLMFHVALEYISHAYPEKRQWEGEVCSKRTWKVIGRTPCLSHPKQASVFTASVDSCNGAVYRRDVL